MGVHHRADVRPEQALLRQPGECEFPVNPLRQFENQLREYAPIAHAINATSGLVSGEHEKRAWEDDAGAKPRVRRRLSDDMETD